jgi:uncharacterized membrane protein (DUF373 family)
MEKLPPRNLPPLGDAHGRSAHGLHAHEEAETKPVAAAEDGFSKFLHLVVHFALRILALIMTLVIFWGVADVGVTIYRHALASPNFMPGFSDMLAIFGAFMLVLIGIELLINILIYIKRDALPLKMVLAIALMAMARKAIMLDVQSVEWQSWLGLALTIAALGLAYWLASYQPQAQQNKSDDYR